MIELEGIGEEERPYVANYAVRITERQSGVRTVHLVAQLGFDVSPETPTIAVGDVPEVPVCVEIAGVGWDGAVGEVVPLNCMP